jgi:hypothetical protein
VKLEFIFKLKIKNLKEKFMKFLNNGLRAGINIIATMTLFISTISFADGQRQTTPLNCEPPILMLDGASYTVAYKYVLATVKDSDLTGVINAISEYSTVGGLVYNKDGTEKSRCTAVIHLDQLSNRTEAGEYVLQLRVDGSCSDYTDYKATNALELTLMRGRIEFLEKIPALKVNQAWKMIPPCEGGGVTGSN